MSDFAILKTDLAPVELATEVKNAINARLVIIIIHYAVHALAQLSVQPVMSATAKLVPVFALPLIPENAATNVNLVFGVFPLANRVSALVKEFLIMFVILKLGSVNVMTVTLEERVMSARLTFTVTPPVSLVVVT